MIKVFSISFILLFSAQYFNSNKAESINWKFPETTKEIGEFIELSTEKHVLFYKHSYKCGLCHMILDDIEKAWILPESKVEMVFIEVNKQKDLAKYLEGISGYRHHSPQVLLFKDKEVIYHETHGKIKVKKIEEKVK